MPSKITIYSRPNCGYCDKAKALLDREAWPYYEVDVSINSGVAQKLKDKGFKTVPQIAFDDDIIGGYFELAKIIEGLEGTSNLIRNEGGGE